MTVLQQTSKLQQQLPQNQMKYVNLIMGLFLRLFPSIQGLVLEKNCYLTDEKHEYMYQFMYLTLFLELNRHQKQANRHQKLVINHQWRQNSYKFNKYIYQYLCPWRAW